MTAVIVTDIRMLVGAVGHYYAFSEDVKFSPRLADSCLKKARKLYQKKKPYSDAKHRIS